ncbi:DNA recombination protein RmuC [Luteimonas yindakuii]|uniref:DNA recombination protein RmuC n=1 Tax=Luteimonas yindakuii TaxID=2565782 RepID=A0A4Z1RGK6_9GAMM|nr:DNA recombination protein RmuC [Luteimonas yindakuii]TKS53249.1 DNA recombination protein RmuC [Luteimonas yindakuii]
MNDVSLLLVLILLAVSAAVILLIVLVLRRPDAGMDAMRERLEAALREEQRESRLELRALLDGLSSAQEQRIDAFGLRLDALTERTESRLGAMREAISEDARNARAESAQAQQRFGAQLSERMADLTARTDQRLEGFGQRLEVLRATLGEDARKARQESGEAQQRMAEALAQRLAESAQRSEQRLVEMRSTLDQQLQRLQADNADKLEQMRATVDEKLQTTLETRLGASFKLVSERLEQVQRGLGEMQQLATGVGDLKRVLTNVKNRGSWGEVQLEGILEQTLIAEQYARSVRVRPESAEAVDFAIRLPGRQDGDTPVWLPIDCKFPREDYERLLDAQELGDAEAVRVCGAQLERAIRIQAKSICEKYVCPPHTTDFAVMFLPTEGLYAETIRRPGLTDALQRDHRIVVAGPTTVTALLNSLQMGFRTLAIEHRSSEVWKLLGAVKSEFGKFAGILEKAEKQINTVGKSLGEASRKTRTIERRLRGVETLSQDESQALLVDAGIGIDAEEPDDRDDASS